MTRSLETDFPNIAIIAGNGVLPGELVCEMERNGRSPVVIGLAGEIDPALAGRASAIVSLGQLGTLFDLLKREKVGEIVLAGGVRKRPDFRRMRLDATTLLELPKLIKIAMGGDNTVLGKVAAYINGKGYEVKGAHEVAPGLVATRGQIAGRKPGKAAMAVVEQAFEAARSIGALDAGQAAIAEDGRVIALEAAEGTDAMIARVAELRKAGRLPATPKHSVLAKAMKPGQDMRADLPTIGPATITAAINAGLTGIAVHACHSMVLGRQETVRLARQAGLFIVGIGADCS